VDQAQAAQAAGGSTLASQGRDGEAIRAAEQDVAHPAVAADEQPDLATEGGGNLGELARRLVTDPLAARHAPPVEVLQGAHLTRLEAAGHAVNGGADRGLRVAGWGAAL